MPLNAGRSRRIRLDLECVTGMKNTLGPWHWTPAWEENRFTGPWSWYGRSGAGGWTEEYHLEPEGIPEGLRLERVTLASPGK